MSRQTAVALTVGSDLLSYEVRTITKGNVSANQAYVSSLTGGKTFREAGNLDATWEISLYAPVGTYEVPAVLRAGQKIKIKTPSDGTEQHMIIDSSSLEVDIEAGTLIGISLSCSAVDADSYPA